MTDFDITPGTEPGAWSIAGEAAAWTFSRTRAALSAATEPVTNSRRFIFPSNR
jgi:hypothetical protein